MADEGISESDLGSRARRSETPPPSTHLSSSPVSTPSLQDEQPTKRRRLDSGSVEDRPGPRGAIFQAPRPPSSNSGRGQGLGLPVRPESAPSSKPKEPADSRPGTPSVAVTVSLPGPKDADELVDVQKPKELTRFSYDDQGIFHLDARSLRYYHPPSGVPQETPDLRPAKHVHGVQGPQADLDGLFDQYKPKTNAIEPLDNLLRALKESGVWTDHGIPGVHLVTWRGILTRLVTTPFNDRDPWEFGAQMDRGVLFMHEHVGVRDTGDDGPADGRRAHMAYWGYRFETLSTLASDPQGMTSEALVAAEASRVAEPVNTAMQFCSVVTTKLGGRRRVVVGAEVDCVHLPPQERQQQRVQAANGSEAAPGAGEYVELKTHRVLRGARDLPGFVRKLARVWAQSFLAGVPRVVFGFRDDHGRVAATRAFRTTDLPRLVRSAAGAENAQQSQQHHHRHSGRNTGRHHDRHHDRQQRGPHLPVWDPHRGLAFATHVLDALYEYATERAACGEYLIVRFAAPFRAVEVISGRPPGQRAVLPDWWHSGSADATAKASAAAKFPIPEASAMPDKGIC